MKTFLTVTAIGILQKDIRVHSDQGALRYRISLLAFHIGASKEIITRSVRFKTKGCAGTALANEKPVTRSNSWLSFCAAARQEYWSEYSARMCEGSTDMMIVLILRLYVGCHWGTRAAPVLL